MAYAQWVAINIRAANTTLTLRNVNIKYGKFYSYTKDDEISISDIEGIEIEAKNSYTVKSCGREHSPSGTEGSFDIYDGDIKVGHYYWDCPWGSKTNTSHWTNSNSNSYSVPLDGANINSGALGNINISILNLTKFSELRESTQEKFRYLSEALGSNTEELSEIRVILETKANLEDLEYVNERIEEISINEYDNAQKIGMIHQMLANIQQRFIHRVSDSSQEENYAVFSTSEIKYDNELLNHPKLMNILASKYGINRAVDISSSLSTTLIQEVTATDNYELLLAGAGSIYLMEVE